MESSDTLRRMVVRHAWILVICMVIGAIASVVMVTTREPLYRTSARVALGGWDPNDAVKAKTLADSARALATSERVVEDAITSARVDRDVDKVASRVSLTASGSSSVVDVAVADEDPAVAAKLANRIAEGVIDVRWNLLRGGIQDLLADVDGRNTALAEQLSALEDEIESAPVGTQRALLALERYGAALQQRSDLADERRRLISLGALQPRASVIDRAEVPTTTSSGDQAVAVMLGIIAGILAGLAIAAAIEILRPSVTGPEAIARAAGGPWLGTLRVRPGLSTNGDVEAAAHGMSLVAASADVGTIAIVPIGVDGGDAAALAHRLTTDLVEASVKDIGTEMGPVTGVARLSLSPLPSPNTGIVVLASYSLPRKDLAPVHHLSEATGWPLVGVLLIKRTRLSRRDRSILEAEDEQVVDLTTSDEGSVAWPKTPAEAGRGAQLDGRSEATPRN